VITRRRASRKQAPDDGKHDARFVSRFRQSILLRQIKSRFSDAWPPMKKKRRRRSGVVSSKKSVSERVQSRPEEKLVIDAAPVVENRESEDVMVSVGVLRDELRKTEKGG